MLTRGAPAVIPDLPYLSIRGDNRFRNYEQLLQQQELLERALGAPLNWQCNSNSNPWIVWNLPNLDPSNRDNWPSQQKILAEKTVHFFRTLDPFIRPLDQQQTS